MLTEDNGLAMNGCAGWPVPAAPLPAPAGHGSDGRASQERRWPRTDPPAAATRPGRRSGSSVGESLLAPVTPGAFIDHYAFTLIYSMSVSGLSAPNGSRVWGVPNPTPTATSAGP